MSSLVDLIPMIFIVFFIVQDRYNLGKLKFLQAFLFHKNWISTAFGKF